MQIFTTNLHPIIHHHYTATHLMHAQVVPRLAPSGPAGLSGAAPLHTTSWHVPRGSGAPPLRRGGVPGSGAVCGAGAGQRAVCVCQQWW